MSRYEIEQELNGLYIDLEIAENNDEQTVCKRFNADSKADFIRVVNDDINFYEALLEDIDKRRY
jgi:hypothetical protein